MKQCVVFLREDTCERLPDAGAHLRLIISTEMQQSYPDGGFLFWRHIDGGWELVFE